MYVHRIAVYICFLIPLLSLAMVGGVSLQAISFTNKVDSPVSEFNGPVFFFEMSVYEKTGVNCLYVKVILSVLNSPLFVCCCCFVQCTRDTFPSQKEITSQLPNT